MIYKPTDLSPSAQTFDVMDTPIFFECKVDTSNVQASGFTIEILDSENNVVFSSIPKGEQLNINYITIIDDLREYVHTYFPDYETGYSLLNTGYNGSYLKFPFSVAYDSRSNNTSAINQIFYIPDPNGIVKGLTEDEIKISSGLYRNNYIWTTGDNSEYIIDKSKPLIPVNIYNGKEYKWSITLYQLENVGTTKNPVWILPENPLMFDMPMTTGTVLGSNNKRIQSAFSEEIYGDYFIQPLWIEGLNYNVGEEDRWTYEKLNNSEIWNKSIIYNINDYVKVINEDTNTEKYYKCIKQTNNNIDITNTEYWKEVEQISQVGNRVMIKSYNMSFGYIYPIEGNDGIPDGDIVPNQANAFRIYKRGNNSDNLTDYQKVSYVLETPLLGSDPSVDENAIATLEWKTSLANAGESYYEQKWSGVIDQSGACNPPGFPLGVLIYPNERVVLNGQDDKSKNGIYYPQFSSEALEGAPVYNGKTGVTINIDLPNTFSNEFDQNGSYTLTYNGSVWQYNNKNYSCNIGDGVVTINDAGLKIIYTDSTMTPSVGDNITFTIKHQTVARWIRTPDADTWGELVNKIVMVTRSGSPYFGKNIQIVKDGSDPEDKTGTINQTPFTFTEELPVEIYKYSFDKYDNSKLYHVGDIVLDNNKKYICTKDTTTSTNILDTEYWRDCTNDIINTTGLIFYNNPVTESNKNGILYIRYFDGIQKGMMLQKLSNDNKYQYFIIDDVGTNGGMYLKYHEVKEFDTYKPYTVSNTVVNANPTKLTADTTWDIDETKYQIKTYFRESDENAFYFYSRPEIDIQFKNTNGVNFTTDRTPLVEAYEWEEGRTYGAGDYVYKDTGISEPYTRTYYLCLVNNVKDIDPSNVAASAGKWLDTGTDGIRNYEYALYYVSGVEYKVGDYVYLSIDDKITYYECLKDKTTDVPNKTGGTSDWLEIPLDINYKKDTIVKYNGVYYIALTNISQLAEPIKPEKENLGIFWEPYVGVLFREDIGFTYSVYSDLKVYDKDSVVYYEGKYYYTKRDITSIQPPVIYEENKKYNIGDIVWINIGGNIVYYKAARKINQIESPIIPGQDTTNSWELYNDFSDFIWNPYTNVQLKDEEGNYIKYPNGWIVVYKGVTYECVTSNDGGIEPENTDTIDSFMNNGSWIKYNKLDGDEIFIDGIRYNKNNTIYTEFNSKEMYLLNRVIYCDGIQYKVTFTVLEYDANTEYKKGDYVSYDVDGVGIYEYYICISDEPIKNQAPVLKDQSNHKELNDNYWAKTVINTLPKITDEEYFGKYVSWVNTKLYNHGDIVLYNNVFYVYINENAQKMSVYNNTTSFEGGDLVRYKESGVGTYKWQFYAGSINLGDAILCDIIPEVDGTYPEDYDSSKYWIPYYGFMYYGDYNDGVSIGRNYYYNNVVKFNNQYYIYVNPNILDTSLSPDQISLTRLKEDIKEFKGEKKYSVGDIVLYNDKYYIYYKDAGDWLYSPANTDYWTLFPWQVFISQIHERTIVCNAEYEQQQYIQWKSVQWFLCDDSGENIIDKSEVIYDGDLTYTFHGVDGREKGTDKPVYFIVRLILETRTGYRMTVERKIEAIYEIEEIDSEGLISAYFDCDTMSIVTEVTKESGFIMPTISETGKMITYSDGESHENGVMSIEGEVNYEKVLYSLESISDIASARDITSESERFEIMGSHTINTDRFSGTIISMSSSVANAITEEVQPKGYFKIYLSELLSREVNNSQDTVLSREEIIVVNNDRNILKWEATDVNGQVPFEGVVEIRDASNSYGNAIGITEGESETGDLSLFFTPQGYITCSNWQPKSFSYTKYTYANYLPITYASCINSNSNDELQVSFDQYRNVRKTLNLYEKEIITLNSDNFNTNGTIDYTSNKAFEYPCKRVQEPIMSISDNFKTDENFGDANKINSTIFGLSDENMLNTEGATNKIYIVGSAPTLCSDFAYKETYGVYEGKDLNNIYIKKKNVMQDFSYAFSDEDLPTNNIWNNDYKIWVDVDFFLKGKYINYNIGELSINNTIVNSYELINGNIIKDGASTVEEGIDEKIEIIFSNSQLGYQKPLTENDKEITEGGIEIDVITERGYLKGQTLIVDAELMMDGDGGITPYPIGNDPSATPEKLVVYVDPDNNFKPPKN